MGKKKWHPIREAIYSCCEHTDDPKMCVRARVCVRVLRYNKPGSMAKVSERQTTARVAAAAANVAGAPP